MELKLRAINMRVLKWVIVLGMLSVLVSGKKNKYKRRKKPKKEKGKPQR